AVEVGDDRKTLERVMERVGAKRSPVKPTLAWAAEKAGRLKLNGQLTGYSPLSRLIELEALMLGVFGKRSMWGVLGAAAADDARLAEFDFGALAERADRQLAALAEHRLAAVRPALAPAEDA